MVGHQSWFSFFGILNNTGKDIKGGGVTGSQGREFQSPWAWSQFAYPTVVLECPFLAPPPCTLSFTEGKHVMLRGLAVVACSLRLLVFDFLHD